MKNNFLSFILDAITANKIEIILIITSHHGIKAPIGTLPSISNTPDINNKVASKFLILNALYEAEATKNASNANIVEPSGR